MSSPDKLPVESDLTYSGKIINSQFARDIQLGLSAPDKYIPCVYFYDDLGSQYFDQICRLPEYYPSWAETEILSKYSRQIAELCPAITRLIELGSGSSVKTRSVIDAYVKRNKHFEYIPIDVSKNILAESSEVLNRLYPELKVTPLPLRYEDGLKQLRDINDDPKMIMWLGSSIGNYEKSDAVRFVKKIADAMNERDRLLIGIDLIKQSHILERAYNDAAGVTARFNLNILKRINRELDSNFNTDYFTHEAVYNSAKRRIEMYLKSRREQKIWIKKVNMEVYLNSDEYIHTENSYKYSLDEIDQLAEAAGMIVQKQWFDTNRWFSSNLFSLT